MGADLLLRTFPLFDRQKRRDEFMKLVNAIPADDLNAQRKADDNRKAAGKGWDAANPVLRIVPVTVTITEQRED